QLQKARKLGTLPITVEPILDASLHFNSIFS
ncbi:unnamed protein product, partial [Allacma fusca]